MTQRPDRFELDYTHPLAKGLVFAGLGNDPGGMMMLDGSGQRNHGTLTNMDPSTDWVFVPELGRWGLDLTDSADHVVVPDEPIVSSITLSMWFRSTTSNGYYWHLLSRHPDWFISGNATTFRINVDTASDTVKWAVFGDSFATIGITSWHHYCGMYDGSTIYAYLDGRLIGNGNTSGSFDYRGFTRIGAYHANISDSALNACGYAVDPLIFERALTPTEIADLADPSNVYLSGLIKGRPRRRYFLPSSPPATFQAAWAAGVNTHLGVGL
jgi:hypothetical protein